MIKDSSVLFEYLFAFPTFITKQRWCHSKVMSKTEYVSLSSNIECCHSFCFSFQSDWPRVSLFKAFLTMKMQSTLFNMNAKSNNTTRTITVFFLSYNFFFPILFVFNLYPFNLGTSVLLLVVNI